MQQEATGARGRHEEHSDEQKSAAEEYGGEEAVLTVADAVTRHTDEPQEGDAGEGNQIERRDDRVSPCAVPDPLAGVVGMVRHRAADQHEHGTEEQREDDAGDRRSTRRTDPLARLSGPPLNSSTCMTAIVSPYRRLRPPDGGDESLDTPPSTGRWETAAPTTAAFATGDGPGVTALVTTAALATGAPTTPTSSSASGREWHVRLLWFRGLGPLRWRRGWLAGTRPLAISWPPARRIADANGAAQRFS